MMTVINTNYHVTHGIFSKKKSRPLCSDSAPSAHYSDEVF